MGVGGGGVGWCTGMETNLEMTPGSGQELRCLTESRLQPEDRGDVIQGDDQIFIRENIVQREGQVGGAEIRGRKIPWRANPHGAQGPEAPAGGMELNSGGPQAPRDQPAAGWGAG